MFVDKSLVTTDWNRTGQIVQAKYLGEIPVEAEILSSRIKYGGSIQHSIVISDDVRLHWNNELIKCGTILLIDEKDIARVWQ